MSYRLGSDESIHCGLLRILREQIERAILELDVRRNREKAIHDARKRFKKIRGVFRLIRSGMGDSYHRENAWYRELGRSLGRAREAQALIETLDELVGKRSILAKAKLNPMRLELVRRRNQIMRKQINPPMCLTDIIAHLRESKAQLKSLPLADGGFDVLGSGLKRTFKRGRKAFLRAYENPTPAHFHEWRKRVKYHWHHIRLLQNIWPDIMGGYRRSLKILADFLGDYHDLAGLRRVLVSGPRSFGNPENVRLVIAMIDQRQTALRLLMYPLGQKVFLETPRSFTRRIGGYWKVWRSEECAQAKDRRSMARANSPLENLKPGMLFRW